MFFGIPRKPCFEFDFLSLYRKFCFSTTSGGVYQESGRRSFQEAIDLITGGEIEIGGMVTYRFQFENVGEAYELARTLDDGVIKIAIEMPALKQTIA